MMISDIKQFDEKVMQAQGTVLVDFYADWCGPCRMMAPVMEEIAEEVKDVSVYKVNVDTLPEAADRFGISSIPTFVALRGGQELSRRIGAADKGTILKMLDK